MVPASMPMRPGWRSGAVPSLAPWRLLAGLLLASLLVLALPALAQQALPVPALSGRVVDQTGTLDAAQVRALTERLAAIEKSRGAQIVVLLLPSTQPEDIASYSQRVADTWKVGRRDVGDGVVIVVAKTDRRVNIEVAKTLEGALPDILAGRIINEQMKPAFRANDYAGGLEAAIDRLDKIIGGEALPAPPQPGSGSSAANTRAAPGFDLHDLAIFLFVGAPVIGAVLTGLFGHKFGTLLTGGAVGAFGWWLTASLLVAFGAGVIALVLVGIVGIGSSLGGRGGRSFGGPVIWGGGFSSGGGGNFGGGGASGSW